MEEARRYMLKARKFEVSFLVKIRGVTEGNGKMTVTGQMIRDKILAPLQEMWLLGHVKSFTLEEIDQRPEKKLERKKKR